MNIEKAIKMERKYFKIFITFMIGISIILPLALILTRVNNLFYWIYLGLIELLIFASIIIRINEYRVDYRCINNRLIFKIGIFTKESVLLCDKVHLIHTNKSDFDLEIILITSVAFKNKSLRLVDKNFIRRYPQLRKHYDIMKRSNGEMNYYFQVIRRGGLKKYLLLDIIYRNCVKAVCTEESINNIKIARGQNIV